MEVKGVASAMLPLSAGDGKQKQRESEEYNMQPQLKSISACFRCAP